MDKRIDKLWRYNFIVYQLLHHLTFYDLIRIALKSPDFNQGGQLNKLYKRSNQKEVKILWQKNSFIIIQFENYQLELLA